MFIVSQQLVLVYFLGGLFFHTDFFPVSALQDPSCGLDQIRIVNILLKPQSHIHGFGPGRATVHPELASR